MPLWRPSLLVLKKHPTVIAVCRGVFFTHQQRLLTRCFGVRKPTRNFFKTAVTSTPPKATTVGYVDLFHVLPRFFFTVWNNWIQVRSTWDVYIYIYIYRPMMSTGKNTPTQTFGPRRGGLNWVVSIVDVGSFAGMITGLLAGIYGQSRIYFVTLAELTCFLCVGMDFSIFWKSYLGRNTFRWVLGFL